MSEKRVQIRLIDSNPFQMRRMFDDEKIRELAESVSTVGLLNKPLVRPHPEVRGRFQLVHGERRLRACRKLGWETIPIIVRELSDEQMAEMNMIENIQRENFNPIEEAEAFLLFIEKFGCTKTTLAKRIGKSRSYVSNMLRLLDMPFFLKAAVLCKTFSVWHARTIMGLPEGHEHYRLADLVMDWGLTVAETRTIVNDIKNGEKWVSWVRDVPVSCLVEYVSKERSFAEYQALINSMRENGQLEPIDILVTGVILDGSGRTNVARILNWKKINARLFFLTDWFKQDTGVIVQSYARELPNPPGIVPELSEEQKKNIKRFVEMLHLSETVEERAQ